MPNFDWTPGGVLHAGPGRIIVRGDANYQQKTTKALGELYQTVAGQTLLNGILGGKPVAISPFSSTFNYNCCYCPAASQRSLLAQSWFDNRNTATLGGYIAAGRLLLGVNGVTLAQRINAVPRYRIQGVPSAVPANFGVTAQNVSDWENNTAGTEFPAWN